MARCMLKAKGLPPKFWGEAVTTAVYVLNRSATKSLENMTPFEAWYGKKPAVHHLRTFGCIVHVKLPAANLKKLDDRSKPMIFVGYEPGSKAYRAYDPVSWRVHVTRDAVFDEEAQWNWITGGGQDELGVDDEFVVEYLPTAAPAGGASSASGATATSGIPSQRGTWPATPAPSPAPSVPRPPVEFVSPPSSLSSGLDADHDDAPLRFRALDNVLGPTTPPGFANREIHVAALLAEIGEEPGSFAEAEQQECWRRAMIEEMQSIEENSTWQLVDLPAGHRAITLKWVYKVKRDEHGHIAKHKARLVARGFVQQQGIDYEEAFAPVARMESVRLVLAVAAWEDWVVHHMDVKSAFLNGDLREEVYVAQPPGFVIDGAADKVLKLKKALYGLRQAPRAWNAKLDASLRNLGFVRSVSEHGVYMRGDGSARLLVGVYVDDLIIAGRSHKEVIGFKEEMKNLFRMSDLGALSYYLGIEVKQSKGGIKLQQSAYAKKLLEKAAMASCNSIEVPMETRLKLSKKSTSEPVDATFYRSIIGSLRYLVHTRPDLAFAVGYVSRFMESPKQDHLVAVKRILCYIAGTIDFGVYYGRGAGAVPSLIGYSDSDLAGDIDDRKSTSGTIFFLSTSPISWQSQKQRVVAQSSCEAEYIAAATASCQGVWMWRLLNDITGIQCPAPKIMVDNKSAIALCKNPAFHDRSKHIQVKYHYIRQCVEDGMISLEFVRSEEQLADTLTKPLGRIKFLEQRLRIGVVNTHD